MSTDFHNLLISDVEQLTDEAIAVTFEVPDELKSAFTYQQGQHITLKVKIKGEELRRSYSICSGVVEQKLQVAIKRIEKGVFSNFANDKFGIGMSIDVMSPQGHFYTPLSSDSEKHYLFIAVGSGITPIISHIQSILSLEKKAKITLVYGNKSVASTMFDKKLTDIENDNNERFTRINLYSQQQQASKINQGRISAQKLIDLDLTGALELRSFSDVFLCGPQEMVNEVTASLKSCNFTDEHLHYELFHFASAEGNSVLKQAERQDNYHEQSSQVSITADGINTKLTLGMSADNILDAAMEQGADLPFACKVGVCASCKAKVIKGKVEMDVNHSLTDEEVAEGFILTCQSHPVTDEVEIDFDFE